MTLPPALVIHGLAHARLALATARPVTLLSAPNAAGFAGAGWWRAMVEAAMHEQGRPIPKLPVPDILDCGAAPGRALEALSLGCRILVLLPCSAWDSVAGRAAAAGTLVLAARPAALDLDDPAAARDLGAWLAGSPQSGPTPSG